MLRASKWLSLGVLLASATGRAQSAGQTYYYDPPPMPPVAEADDCDPDIEVCLSPGVTQATPMPEGMLDDGYDPQAYTQFESTLSPYGSWVEDPTYGRVWVPSSTVVGDDFTPYASGGYWADSDYGWAWVSDWDWGWAPFHYGRWLTLAGFGWCWVPGTVWGPAWVDWRFGNGYAGWAPLPPAGVVIGPPTVARSGWRFTLAADLGRRSPSFVPHHVAPAIYARTLAVRNLRTAAIGGSTVRFNAGPPTAQVSASLGRDVHVTRLAEVAPHMLPRTSIVARAGTPLASRPWVTAARAGRSVTVAPARASGYPPPAVHTPATTYPPPAVHAPATTYTPPAAHAPATTYPPPAVHAPATTYTPPASHYPPPAQTYRAPVAPPAYHYQAPSPQTYRVPAAPPAYHYQTPAQTYRAPAAPPAYHYQAPVAPPAYHYQAPAQTYHAPVAPPAYHYQAPAPSYGATHVAPAPAPSVTHGHYGFHR
jgi:hypothetical protein